MPFVYAVGNIVSGWNSWLAAMPILLAHSLSHQRKPCPVVDGFVPYRLTFYCTRHPVTRSFSDRSERQSCNAARPDAQFAERPPGSKVDLKAS